MGDYGMMECSGWPLGWWIWWTGGLVLFGAVIYAAVRLGTTHSRDSYYDHYNEYQRRDYREDNRGYYRNDDQHWGERR